MRFAARAGDAWVTYGAGEPGPGDSVEDAVGRFLEPAARFDAVEGSSGVRRLALLGLDERGGLPPTTRASRRRWPGRVSTRSVVHWPREDGRGVPAELLRTVLAAHGLG